MHVEGLAPFEEPAGACPVRMNNGRAAFPAQLPPTLGSLISAHCIGLSFAKPLTKTDLSASSPSWPDTEWTRLAGPLRSGSKVGLPPTLGSLVKPNPIKVRSVERKKHSCCNAMLQQPLCPLTSNYPPP